jgi:hypothetical protein
MTKFFKDYASEDGFVHHDVKGRDFGFSSGSHDMVDDMSNVENGAIIGQYMLALVERKKWPPLRLRALGLLRLLASLWTAKIMSLAL